MTKFLRLFPAYRSLEAQLEESASARIRAEDEIRVMRERVVIAEADKEKARDAETHSLKLVADWQAHVNGLPPIFGIAPIPREEEPPVEVPRRRHARDLVRDLEKDFQREYRDMIDRETSNLA